VYIEANSAAYTTTMQTPRPAIMVRFGTLITGDSTENAVRQLLRVN
jgi:hypothetical protein